MQMQLRQRSQDGDGLIPNAASHITTFQLPCTDSVQKEVSRVLSLPQPTVSCNPFDLCNDMGALLLEVMVYPPFNTEILMP